MKLNTFQLRSEEITALHRYQHKAARVGLFLLLLHIPAMAGVAWFFGQSILFALLVSIGISVGPVVLHILKAYRLEPAAMGIASMAYSALLIHLGGGLIEFHFHIFACIGVLALTGSWLAILAAAVTIALHHVLFYIYLPASVFNYDASIWIVALHAFFVVFESVPMAFIARYLGRLAGVIGSLGAPLTSVSQHLRQAASQMREISTVQAENSARQAAATQETDQAAHQVQQLTEEVGQRVGRVDGAMRTTHALTQTGTARMDEMRQAMEEVQVSNQEISKIVEALQEVAFQTNILALNAAVEAARAGEAGAGFAVVAEEVRALAQRAAKSASETEGLIRTAQQNTQRGVQLAQLADTELKKIATEVAEARTESEQMAQMARNQTRLIHSVTDSMNEIDRASQTNAANAQEAASSSEELRSQAHDLQQLVARVLQVLDTSGSVEKEEKEAPAQPAKPVFKPKPNSDTVRPSTAKAMAPAQPLERSGDTVAVDEADEESFFVVH